MDTINKIVSWIIKNPTIVITVILAVVEISPIKFRPIRFICTWIGKIILEDVKNDISDIKKDIISIKENIDAQNTKNEEKFKAIEDREIEDEMDRIRWEILSFANSLRHKISHSKDEFEHIITLNEKYEHLLTLKDVPNGVFEIEYQYIISIYKKYLEDNSFPY